METSMDFYEETIGAVVNHEKTLTFSEMARLFAEGIGLLAVRRDGVYRVSGCFRSQGKRFYELSDAYGYFVTDDPGIICRTWMVENVNDSCRRARQFESTSREDFLAAGEAIDALDERKLSGDTVVGISSFVYKGFPYLMTMTADQSDAALISYFEGNKNALWRP